jgi:hypothetical protein
MVTRDIAGRVIALTRLRPGAHVRSAAAQVCALGRAAWARAGRALRGRDRARRGCHRFARRLAPRLDPLDRRRAVRVRQDAPRSLALRRRGRGRAGELRGGERVERQARDCMGRRLVRARAHPRGAHRRRELRRGLGRRRHPLRLVGQVRAPRAAGAARAAADARCARRAPRARSRGPARRADERGSGEFRARATGRRAARASRDRPTRARL